MRQPLEIEVERIISVGKTSPLLDNLANLWIRGISEEKLLNHEYVCRCFRMQELLLEGLCVRVFLLVRLRLNLIDRRLDPLDGLLLQRGRSRLWVAQRCPEQSCHDEQKNRKDHRSNAFGAMQHGLSPFRGITPQLHAQCAHGRLMLYSYQDHLTAVIREGRLGAVISITPAEIDRVIVSPLAIDDRLLLVTCHAHFGFPLDIYLCLGIHPFLPLQVG
jgi:hypothetical protein